MSKSVFEVDIAGFRQLQAGKSKTIIKAREQDLPKLYASLKNIMGAIKIFKCILVVKWFSSQSRMKQNRQDQNLLLATGATIDTMSLFLKIFQVNYHEINYQI